MRFATGMTVGSLVLIIVATSVAATAPKKTSKTAQAVTRHSSSSARINPALHTKDLGPDLATKTITWTDQRAGNCHMTGVLTMYSDGTAHWDATTKTDSTHNYDVWHEYSIDIKDSQGTFLFGFGPWDSPHMNSPPNGGDYNWSDDGRFPPSLFDRVTQGTSNGAC
jgi:hypothetical protein